MLEVPELKFLSGSGPLSMCSKKHIELTTMKSFIGLIIIFYLYAFTFSLSSGLSTMSMV